MAIKNYVTLVEKWEEDKYTAKKASTVMQNGGFLSLALGYALPSTAGDAILGVGMDDILSTDSDYTSTRMIPYQTSYNNYFRIGVGAGTATQAMVGSRFNLYDAQTIDVTAYNTINYNTLAVGVFAVGETITGGTSGATGVITVTHTVNGQQQLVYTVTAGTFVSGETITGGTSSSTAKVLNILTGGTQLEITKFISATQVEVKVVLIA